MGKTKKIFVALLLAILTLFCFAGCAADTDELQDKIDGLQSRIEELEAQIKDRDEEIAQLEESVEKLMEENSGAFYTMQGAYDNGYLTKADLMSIAYYHNGGRKHNEEIMDEAYTPAPKTPETLSEVTELLIKRTAAKDYRENHNINNAEASGFTITEYDGTYGDCVAVIMRDDYSGSAGVVEVLVETIGGVNYYYTGRTIKIWKRDGVRGKEINSETIVETTLYSWTEKRKDFIAICNSLDEFKEKCLSNGYDFFDSTNQESNCYNTDAGEKIREYTDEYFEDKSFVVCAFYKSSWLGQYLIDKVEVKSNKLTLYIKYPRSDTADEVVNNVFLIAGVDKPLVADVTDIEYVLC